MPHSKVSLTSRCHSVVPWHCTFTAALRETYPFFHLPLGAPTQKSQCEQCPKDGHPRLSAMEGVQTESLSGREGSHKSGAFIKEHVVKEEGAMAPTLLLL